MHELSLMQGVVEILLRAAAEHGVRKISRVRLVVGKMAAVLPAALEFSFKALQQGTLLEGAVLEIEEKGIEARCLECSPAFATGDRLRCPSCGSARTEVVTGRELYVDFFEGE